MSKLSWGSVAIILGGLLLSIQFYGLRFIHWLDQQDGTYASEAIIYATREPEIKIALIINIGIILYGVFLVIISFKEQNKK